MLPIPPSTTGEPETLSIPMSHRLIHTHAHAHTHTHTHTHTHIHTHTHASMHINMHMRTHRDPKHIQTHTPKHMHMLRCIRSVPAGVYKRCHIYDNHLHTHHFNILLLCTTSAKTNRCAWLPFQRESGRCDPLSQHMTCYRGPLHTAIQWQTHTHTHTFTSMHTCRQTDSNIWYKCSICTQADACTRYKSDSCRYDGALREEEVKA